MKNISDAIQSRPTGRVCRLAFLIAALLAIVPSPVLAYSGIADINGWSAERLREVGITVRPWTHDNDSDTRDFPAMRWVEVCYDWKRMGPDRHVEMTLYSANHDGKLMAACRAEHRKGRNESMKLIFAVPEENIRNCHVWILFPGSIAEAKDDVGNKVFGLGDGAQGYSLDLTRIVALAGEKPAAGIADPGQSSGTAADKPAEARKPSPSKP